ncbi:ZrgA family zinc uptake protein [Bowmanella denitrificans]|uniref:ZrgA family zinc uptake protein n=1 Tax=Bowmanella denitrificans TaxID=366582 RepID=UPI001559AC25|nr:DUF2796 domain-containing protein [Bowmanella denitrificans]
MNKSHWLRLALILSLSPSALAQQHTHGQGELQIAQDGERWHLQLILPAADALGFEHEAKTSEQKKAQHHLAHKLTHNAGVVKLTGQCSLVSAEHSLQAVDNQNHPHKHHEHHDDNEQHHEHRHSNIEVTYQYDCASAVTQLALPLFESMPSLSLIKAQWLTDKGQGVANLTSSHPYIGW